MQGYVFRGIKAHTCGNKKASETACGGLPRDLSFVWLVDLTTGRLARVRLPLEKGLGASPSDMASKESPDVSDKCSIGSPKLGGWGLWDSLGLLVCKRHMRESRKSMTSNYAENVCNAIRVCQSGQTIWGGVWNQMERQDTENWRPSGSKNQLWKLLEKNIAPSIPLRFLSLSICANATLGKELRKSHIMGKNDGKSIPLATF